MTVDELRARIVEEGGSADDLVTSDTARAVPSGYLLIRTNDGWYACGFSREIHFQPKTFASEHEACEHILRIRHGDLPEQEFKSLW